MTNTATRFRRLALFLLLVPLIASIAYGQQPEWLDDVSEAVGLDGVGAWRLYVSDVDGDDYPDIFIVNGVYKRGQLHLWLNRPDPENAGRRIFVDFTEESGINAHPDPNVTDGRVADVGALADVDNDGDVDLVTGRFWYSPANIAHEEDVAEVMLNDGTGRFSHVAGDGLDKEFILNATGMSFLDYDLDGNLDLYVGTFSVDHGSNYYQNDLLFRGNGDGTFTNVSRESGIDAIAQPLYGASVSDWNNDGWPDVITAPYCRTNGSLWMNNGDGTFTDVAPTVGYNARTTGGDNGQNLCQWEGLPADYDNDGDLDILQVLVHGGYHPGEGRTVIAVNGGAENSYNLSWDHSRVIRSAPAASHLGDMSASWIDLDQDGLLDLVINQSQYPQANTAGQERTYLLMQNEQNVLEDRTAEFGLLDSLPAPASSEVIDYDLDGDDDLLIVINSNRNQNNSLRLLENNATGNNRIGVKLNAPEGVNRDAIGARITVTADGRTQMQEITAGHGHFGGQQPLVRNFGIGSATTVDRIEVRWPVKGLPTTVLEGVEANRTVTIGRSLGVDESSSEQHRVAVSPQPVDDRVTVDHPAIGADRIWAIFDGEGRRLLEGTTAAGRTLIDVAPLPSGRYVLTIEERGDRGAEQIVRPLVISR